METSAIRLASHDWAPPPYSDEVASELFLIIDSY